MRAEFRAPSLLIDSEAVEFGRWMGGPFRLKNELQTVRIVTIRRKPPTKNRNLPQTVFFENR
jgi:hypothetical protein